MVGCCRGWFEVLHRTPSGPPCRVQAAPARPTSSISGSQLLAPGLIARTMARLWLLMPVIGAPRPADHRHGGAVLEGFWDANVELKTPQ